MAVAILPNYFEFGVHKTTVPMSDFAIVNDAVLRSDNNIMFQSGTGAAALYIKKSDNKIGIGNSAPSEVLDVTGITKSSSGYKTGSYGQVIDSSGNFLGLNATLTNNLSVDENTLYVNGTNSNVGIGTSTPNSSFKLDVAGHTRIKGNLTVDGTTTVVNTTVDSQTSEQLIITNDGTGPAVTVTQKGTESILLIKDDDNTCFFIKDGGKILIGGIAASDYHLDVSGNTHFVNNVDVSQNVNISGNAKVIGSLTCGSMQIDGDFGVKGNFDLSENFRIRTDKFVITPTGTVDMSGNLTVRNKFQVTTAGNTDMSGNLTVNVNQFKVTAATGNLDMSGNLAISDKFLVTAATGATDLSGNFTIATDKFKVTASTGDTDIYGTLDVSDNFSVNVDVLFVDVTTNKVGINDATPEHALDVTGDIATTQAIMFNNSTDGAFGHRSCNNATDYALKQTSAGITKINCKAGAGNIQFTHGDAGGVAKQEFDSNGNVIIQGNLFSYSDARIKTNVETISNALDKVISIRGVTYNMIKDVENDPDNAPKHIGVIAQEIESVIPEAVKEENGIKTVAYGNIVGLLIEAIKELKDQIQK